MDIDGLRQMAVATLVAVAWKIVGALALWLVGRWLIAEPPDPTFGCGSPTLETERSRRQVHARRRVCRPII